MNHEIPLDEAIEMNKRYRDNYQAVLGQDYKTVLCLSETFDKAAIKKLVDQDNCAYIRIYYGMDENLNVHAVIVGADENDNDMIEGAENPGVVMEQGMRCPMSCPPASVLNQ